MNIISIIGDISVLAAKTIAENSSRDIVKLVGGWLVSVDHYSDDEDMDDHHCDDDIDDHLYDDE